MKKRAQAALEFLMTYGWAILIMLVVISVLFFLGVFSPQATVSKSCTLPAGFTCYDFDMDASGNIYLDIGQATGKTITITGIGCAPSSPNATLNPNVQIPSGSHAIVTIGGTNCSGATNSAFKGKLLIQYTVSGSSGTRSVTGDVSAPLIGNSSSWGSGSYSGGTFLYRRQVTINTGVASDLTDFPAYFIMNTQALIPSKMNATCKDLRVLDSTMSTLLDYEIENGTCNTTSTVVWFRIPQTKGSNNYIANVFYGNNSTSDAQNKAGVWASDYLSVYHMGDVNNSATGGAGSSVNAVLNSSGKFGSAFQFNGYTSYLNLGSKSSLGATNAISVSAWVNFADVYNHSPSTGWVKTIYSWGDEILNTSVWLGYGNSGGLRWWWETCNGTQRSTRSPFITINTGQWYYVAGTFNRTNSTHSNMTTYLDSAPIETASSSGLVNSVYSGPTSNNEFVGEYSQYGFYFNGTIDELRVSRVARTPDWISAEYDQTYSVGSEQVN